LVPLFEDAINGTNLSPKAHYVRADLLDKATAQGGIDEALSVEIADALHSYALDVDLLLLTCSSLSSVVDGVKASGVPAERTDRLLAEAVFAGAMKTPGAQSVAVLIAAPTTVVPTRTLFEQCRVEMGAEAVGLKVILLPDVWSLFLSGDLEAYRQALAKAIDAFLTGADAFSHVALGQASMGPALAFCQSPRANSVWTITGATRAYLAAM
ncbi:hypothetical protein, partial [Cohaesibacter celericrescens]